MSQEDYEQHHWDKTLSESEIYYIFGGTVIALSIVSIVVISQVMRTNLLAQIREFGTLNALGFRRRSLSFIAMRQGFWSGIMVAFVSILLFFVIKAILNWFLIPVYMNGIIIAMGFFILVLVSMLSGFFSVGVLKRIELTSLLR